MITGLDPNTALVLVDYQQAVLKMPSIVPINTLLANTNKLITAFRKANLPVVIVRVAPVPPERVLRRDIPSPGGVGYTPEMLEIVSDIVVQPEDIVITKHTWGAFHNTLLDEELKKRQITGIVLTGVATSRGVESTARAASERGYNITFAEDAMSDLVESAHENSLNVIFPRLGEVGDTDAIVAVLSK